jgi:hypothetical protein
LQRRVIPLFAEPLAGLDHLQQDVAQPVAGTARV